MHTDGARERHRIGGLRAILSLALLLLALPREAWAHAHLLRSTPASGATVATPREIRLVFSEAPELSLSTLELTDSAGVKIPTGRAMEDSSGAMAIRFTIGAPLAPGLYHVRWITAAMDGHPSSGKFTFRVVAVATDTATAFHPLASPARHADTVTMRSSADIDSTIVTVTTLDPSYVAVRALSFAALLALIGAVTFSLAVLPGVLEGSSASEHPAADTVARGALGAAVAYLVLAAIRLAMQSRMMHEGAMDAAQFDAMAMGTRWGLVWRLQIGAAVVALAGAFLALRRTRHAWLLAALGCVGLAIGSALGGHAGAADQWRGALVLDDALHILAAASWLGCLLWLVVAGLDVPRRQGEGRAERALRLVHAFSPVALVSATIVAVTGAFSGWMHLGSVAMLVSSRYGQVLLVKLALVALVAALGAYHWRRVRPVLGTDAASARLARSSTVELAVGALVLIATAVLVGTATP